jgi:hypothetical protein
MDRDSHQPSLLRICQSHGLDPGRLVLVRPSSPAHPLTRYRCDGVVVEVAVGEAGRRRLRVEASGRAWADKHGIPTVPVLDTEPDGAWLLSAWVDPCAAEGPDYVRGAIEVADRIAATPEPPDVELDASSWRAPRRTVVTRAVRNITGGVPLRLWLAARRQARSVPHPRAVAHGDFYPRNVLWARSGIHVVDWEYVGWAPRHTDLLRLWSILRRRDDRDRVISSVLADADDQERARVGSLLLWLSLRLLGENLSAARANRNAADLAHARAMVPEASRLARQLGAWPL